MRDINLAPSRARDLLWRLGAIESRLVNGGRADLAEEFALNTEYVLAHAFLWDGTQEGHNFWSRLSEQLLDSSAVDLDLIQGARRAVAKYLKEAGYEV